MKIFEKRIHTKNTKTLLFSFIFILSSFPSPAQGVWTQKADFGGGMRNYGTGFSIGSKGYIGLGRDSTFAYANDFWEWDETTNAWSQIANFPAAGRSGSVGFSINNKGYVGTGCLYWTASNPNEFPPIYFNDFWEYDPTLNSWIQKANFPGVGRYYATGFSVGTKGYIGTGLTDPGGLYPVNDFWEYNPATDSWSAISFPGVGRGPGVGFSIGTKGYFGTGNDSTTGPTQDWWEYNPSNGSWTQLANVPVFKCGAAGFSIGTMGYLGTGQETGFGNTVSFWEYNSTTNIWLQKADFGGLARRHAVGFSILGKGYFGTGSSYKDFWEYDPNAVGITESQTQLAHSIYPNPMSESATLEIKDERAKNKEMIFELYDVQGKQVLLTTINEQRTTIERGNLSAGTYVYEITNGTTPLASGKLIIQ